MNINFSKATNGLVPVIVQDAATQKVLMLGYMNEEALVKTQTEGRVTFFSRSRQRLWTKGETSGNFVQVANIKTDCDKDCILIQAKPTGPVCHKGTDTCFDEKNTNPNFLVHLETVVKHKKDFPDPKSYTSSLFSKGINKIAQKVGEEAVELVIEAKDNNDGLFKNEAADLLYHLVVLLQAKNISLEEVMDVLKQRHSG
jgi:phosphoribosyl-AMP cyclohydrolase / phosphoribosyl-ATP pyrophosphohydrolase